MPVDLGTLTRVDPGQFGAVGGRDWRADRAVALSYTDVVTQTACWEERSQVCDEIRLALAEVRRRTPSAEPAWGPRGTTPRLIVRGTAAGAPPPPPPPTHPLTHSPTHPLTNSPTHPLTHSPTHPLTHSPLVTWHQSKNPQDGSCETACPHALPRLKPVVIRLDFSCVFPVSGRAHPARQPSRTPPWARHAVLWGTDAHTWPPPDRQTPTWRLPR